MVHALLLHPRALGLFFPASVPWHTTPRPGAAASITPQCCIRGLGMVTFRPSFAVSGAGSSCMPVLLIYTNEARVSYDVGLRPSKRDSYLFDREDQHRGKANSMGKPAVGVTRKFQGGYHHHGMAEDAHSSSA